MTITPKDLRNAADDLRVAPCLRRSSDRIIAARLDWAAARIEKLEMHARVTSLVLHEAERSLMRAVGNS